MEVKVDDVAQLSDGCLVHFLPLTSDPKSAIIRFVEDCKKCGWIVDPPVAIMGIKVHSMKIHGITCSIFYESFANNEYLYFAKPKGCNLSPAPESRLFSPKPANSVRDLGCY